jgi:predicted NUDIX family NTP pyrophosphohydrolase
MVRRSAGILLYKCAAETLFVLLVHPGGPFWRRRDLGAWSIPKGEYAAGEEPEAAARREFTEETGYAPHGILHPLGELRQRGGKIVTAFATAGDFEAATLLSNTFEMEWPPGSGRVQLFPEIDRAEWFSVPEAREKIVAGQRPFLDRLEQFLATRAQ